MPIGDSNFIKRDWLPVSVLALWQTDDLSSVYLAFHPVKAGIGSSTTLNWINEGKSMIRFVEARVFIVVPL